MIWSILLRKKPKQTTLDDVFCAVQQLRKDIRMDFTALDAVIAKLQADTSSEIANAVAAIQAAQANPADTQHLADAVTALQTLDAVIAGVNFGGTSTNTTT